MVIFHSLLHNDVNPISQDCRKLWVLKCLDLVFHTVSRWLIPNTMLFIISWQNNELYLSCHSREGKEKYLGFLLCLFFFFFLIQGRIFYLFIYFYIYFWLCWVFVSVLGLPLVAASGGHSSSRCAGLFTITASLVAEHRLQTRRLSSCGSRAQLLRGMGDLPRPGLEPASPALAGRLSTTAPPGKPCLFVFESKEHFVYLLGRFYFLNPIVIPGRDVWVSHQGLRWALIPDYLQKSLMPNQKD